MNNNYHNINNGYIFGLLIFLFFTFMTVPTKRKISESENNDFEDPSIYHSALKRKLKKIIYDRSRNNKKIKLDLSHMKNPTAVVDKGNATNELEIYDPYTKNKIKTFGDDYEVLYDDLDKPMNPNINATKNNYMTDENKYKLYMSQITDKYGRYYKNIGYNKPFSNYYDDPSNLTNVWQNPFANPYQMQQAEQVEGQWNRYDWNNPAQYNTQSYVNSQRWNSNVIGADNNYELKQANQIKDAALEEANKKIQAFTEREKQSFFKKLDEILQRYSLWDWTKWGVQFSLAVLVLGSISDAIYYFVPYPFSYILSQLFSVVINGTDYCEKIFGLSKRSIQAATVVKSFTGGVINIWANHGGIINFCKDMLSTAGKWLSDGINGIWNWITSWGAAFNASSLGYNTALETTSDKPWDVANMGSFNHPGRSTTSAATYNNTFGTNINETSPNPNYYIHLKPDYLPPSTFNNVDTSGIRVNKDAVGGAGKNKHHKNLWRKLRKENHFRRKLLKRFPRRHLFNHKRLGGAIPLKVGYNIPQGQNLVYENPLKQLLNGATKSYLHTTGYNPSTLTNMPEQQVGYDYDWDIENRLNGLDRRAIKELQYKIATNYAQQLPQFDPQYYTSPSPWSLPGRQIIDPLKPYRLVRDYIVKPTYTVDPSKPFAYIKNYGDNRFVTENDLMSYDNGTMTITDPLLQFNKGFAKLNSDQILKNAPLSNFTKLKQSPRFFFQNLKPEIAEEYKQKMKLQREVLKNDLADAINKMYDSIGKKEAANFKKYQQYANQLQSRILSDEEIDKRAKIYQYAKLDENYKNQLVNAKIDPQYDNYTKIVDADNDICYVNENEIRNENVDNSQNTSTFVNRKWNENMYGHPMNEKFKNADVYGKLQMGLDYLWQACASWKKFEGSHFQEALQSLNEADFSGFSENIILCVKNVLRIFPTFFYIMKSDLVGGVTPSMKSEIENGTRYCNAIFITCTAYWLYRKGKLSNYGFLMVLWYFLYDYYEIINLLTGGRLPAIADIYNQNYGNAKSLLSDGMKNSWLPLQLLFNFGSSFLFNSHPYVKILFQAVPFFLKYAKFDGWLPALPKSPTDTKGIIGTIGAVGTLFSAFGSIAGLLSASGLFNFLNTGQFPVNDNTVNESNFYPNGAPTIPNSLTNFNNILGNAQQFQNFYSTMKRFGIGKKKNKLFSRRKLLLNINSKDALSNFDIEEIIQKEYHDFNKKFLGTFCWDELVLPIPKKKDLWGIIINTLTTQARPNEIGHWVALVVNNKKRQFLYYDSFGDNPQKFTKFKELLKKFKKYPNDKYQLKINAVQNQNSNTSNCGFFAINFLRNILQDHVSFKQATDFNSVVGEKKIALLKKSFGLI